MAYVIDLEDDETDIPVTLTRSKADCPNQEVCLLHDGQELVC
jgi:hypothetical protein